jgi:hypothetical protein
MCLINKGEVMPEGYAGTGAGDNEELGGRGRRPGERGSRRPGGDGQPPQGGRGPRQGGRS